MVVDEHTRRAPSSTEESPPDLSLEDGGGIGIFIPRRCSTVTRRGEGEGPGDRTKAGVAFASIADELANDSIITAKLSRQVPLSSSTEETETAGTR